ncbi:acyl-CoA desaturase [Methylovorus menthalis]|uniref:acyl-CoA desaturase n=1 Tax=Methylovorus menthalis TaxID=1002227 RepID=UPI001E3BAC70|nr:acyl-CoA desaturase [Methylovorus menthalis]MCB4811824.1 acyl-CoA desaturase [Methylovorus menthalis]
MPQARPLQQRLLRWLDSSAIPASDAPQSKQVDWLRALPFVGLHLACLAVIWVGWSPVAVLVAGLLYLVRMFAITGFYHRYFSHRAFKTSRLMQFLFALLGATAVQRGPLWWASMHRHHHANSDRVEDAHSPVHHGFFWSHVGWFLSDAHFATRTERVKELAALPELRFLDRFDIVVPLLLAVGIYALGAWLESIRPEWGTNGWQMLVWGFVISTVLLYHATFSVNSLAHHWGSRRYQTADQSRNNALIALFTLGEGWHNNHHHYPGAARQGFYWWEIDITWYGLKALQALGLIRDLRSVPADIRNARRVNTESTS